MRRMSVARLIPAVAAASSEHRPASPDMGNGNRGQLRPHFAGRSPPFLVAALCIGCCILAVSYYSLSTQSSNTESKLALMIQKSHDLTSELETCRSQLQVKEREFDQTKAELEKVKHELQVSRDKNELHDTEMEELKSASQKQKADLSECRESVSKLNADSKQAAAVADQLWKEKETKWLKDKQDLEAEAERMRELLKKKNLATDELSNNAEEGKIDPKIDAAAAGAVAVNEAPKSGSGVLPVPVVDKNMGDAAPVIVKAKDEIAVLPETR